ncbi:lasso peptide biosynthesis B2 protein [Sphingobium olei]|uniref:Lasso peptide biosynthesis B2 protein n=1 Tax=Sphingobium olei TaxID=420955 RepID=A0ABW3NXF9_9SPHN
MPLALCPGVSFCIVNDAAVFLDLNANRYFCLKQPDIGVLTSLRDAAPGSIATHPILRPLMARGLVREGSTDQLANNGIGIVEAVRDLTSYPLTGNGKESTIRAVLTELSWSATLKMRSLASIAETLGAKRNSLKDAPPDNSNGHFVEIAAALERSALITGVDGRCLPRSLAYISLCRHRSIATTLVFGVRLNPFQAHCWVQHKQTVLNDRLEHVRCFTPILAI